MRHTLLSNIHALKMSILIQNPNRHIGNYGHEEQ